MEGTLSRNVLTIDVEDYFHVEAFASVVSTSDWDRYACRVEGNTMRLLDLLDQQQARATCFILGWVAERYPALIREIVRRGHEPACHSYWHRRVYTLNHETFREDTQRAKDLIEQAAGTAVHGYRAPSYSITSRSLWALEILAGLGFSYDSSIFPIHHDTYGIPGAPRLPFRVNTPSGPLIEYPITTFRCAGQNLPVGGGGYLRMLPYWYTQFGIARLDAESIPLIVYVHPWEVDPEQPRLAGPWKSRLRHYTNLKGMETRLRRLLRTNAPFCAFRDSGLEQMAGLADHAVGSIA
jgi:polysaccharide deacetylase family protein (PEP-CTERM system associated)